MKKLQRVSMFALALAAVAGIGRASAQTTAGQGVDVAARHPAAPLLEQYCFRCHGAQTQTAGVNLDGLIAQRPLVRNREAWTRVMDAVEVGKMPPAGAPPTGRRRTRDAPRSALGFHRQLRLLHRRRPGLRADAATHAPRARQHAARPARRRLHAQRPLPGRADRRQRLRQHGQHAVPRVDADGALYRGGRAGRRADAPRRTVHRGRAARARPGVRRHARRRTCRRGSGRAGAPPLPGARLPPSAGRGRPVTRARAVPCGSAVGAGVRGRREGRAAVDSDFTQVPPAHRDAPGDGGPRALPHKRLGPGLAPLLLAVGVDARRRAARSRPPR